MKVKVILNGGLRSCCSSYPPELIQEILKDWVRAEDELEVIDKQKSAWEPDELARLAEQYFSDAIYPLLYVGDVLVTVGDLPDKETLQKILSDPKKYSLTKEDILEEASRRGLRPSKP